MSYCGLFLVCLQACLVQNVFGLGFGYDGCGLAGPYNGMYETLASPCNTLGPYNTFAGPYNTAFDTFASPCNSLAGPFNNFAGPFNGLAGPFNGLAGPFNGLAGPFNSLTGPPYAYEGFNSAPYGGAGIGNCAIGGELPVGGATAVAGQVPIIGGVEFGGIVPAAGAVTIAGNCACGCGGPYLY